ncbi:hypothetical protein LP419_33535 [Massilia sp. H-1]|nr:hypothetical protein LP419_33535 [Massilia sp. H-1]
MWTAWIPLIVVTELPDGDGWAVEPKSLSHLIHGIAVVVLMRTEMTYLWRDLMPARLNVFGGAVRIYMPMNKGKLYAPIRIPRERHSGDTENIENWAVNIVLESSIRSPIWIDRHSNYETARQIQVRQQRLEFIANSKSDHDIDSMSEMYEAEIAALSASLIQERAENREWAAGSTRS